MSTAVLDFDLERAGPVEGLDRYADALVLVRFRGRPVHQLMLPVVGGHVSAEMIRSSAYDHAGSSLWDPWLEAFLDREQEDLEQESGNGEPPNLELATRGPTHGQPDNRQRRTGHPEPRNRGAHNWEPANRKPATVAVCTRDRPDDLRRCLHSLARLADEGHEILVIDNAPATDESRRVVEACGFARYVREDRPGASAARNRALREASHDIIAFSDDDAAADPVWLPALLRNFDDPLVLCVTGLTMPRELETNAQCWFERYSPFGRGFTRTVYDGAEVSPFSAWRAGASVNMAVRRAVLDRVGVFNEALGPGTRSRTGEDYEFFARILAAGYRIVYDPAALSWHSHRRTWTELRRVQRAYGTGAYAAWTHFLLAERELVVPKHALAWLLRTQLPNLFRSVLRRPGSIPVDLVLAELAGCLVGPWSYVSARRALRRQEAAS